MRVLRAAERVASPWKNGGGITREVAAWPPGAGFDDFAWRVSMAEVRVDGPFSAFPGVDRILAVLEGRLALAVEGVGAFDLTPASPPAAFPGDAATVGRMLGGPVLDLNVMLRRGVARAHVEVDLLASGAPLHRAAGARLVVAGGGGVRVKLGGQVADLSRLDAVMAHAEDGPLAVSVGASEATIYIVSFDA